MKKIVQILMLSMLFILAPQFVHGEELTIRSMYENGSNTNGYDTLNDNQKNLYTKLNNQVLGFGCLDDTGEYGYCDEYPIIAKQTTSLSKDEIHRTVCALRADNPGYWWLNNVYYYADNGDSINVYLISYEEYTDENVRMQNNELIYEAINSYENELSTLESDYERILWIHDRIAKEVVYAYTEQRTPESSNWAHSILGTFDEHKAVVCEGYAKTYAFLLNLCKISNYYVCGYAGEYHAWNLISADQGQTYFNVDLTWDDMDADDPAYWYYYFGLPSVEFEKTHTVDTDWSFEPPLSESSLVNYAYIQKNLYCFEPESFESFLSIVSEKSFLINQAVYEYINENYNIGNYMYSELQQDGNVYYILLADPKEMLEELKASLNEEKEESDDTDQEEKDPVNEPVSTNEDVSEVVPTQVIDDSCTENDITEPSDSCIESDIAESNDSNLVEPVTESLNIDHPKSSECYTVPIKQGSTTNENTKTDTTINKPTKAQEVEKTNYNKEFLCGAVILFFYIGFFWHKRRTSL